MLHVNKSSILTAHEEQTSPSINKISFSFGFTDLNTSFPEYRIKRKVKIVKIFRQFFKEKGISLYLNKNRISKLKL